MTLGEPLKSGKDKQLNLMIFEALRLERGRKLNLVTLDNSLRPKRVEGLDPTNLGKPLRSRRGRELDLTNMGETLRSRREKNLISQSHANI